MSFPEKDMFCAACGKEPHELQEYVEAAKEMGCEPWEYVVREEGTYNRENGHFLCDDCYVTAGCPTSPRGWVAP
jgi:hypothetical protein